MNHTENKSLITLFLCGDVMTGRGIDQILPFPSDPILYERYMKSALGYVDLAETIHGHIQRPVDFGYIWGDSLKVMEQVKPDLRIINLETAITTNPNWERKGINYRMNPRNVPCLTVAKIDVCALANNHVLDWSDAGLIDTVNALKQAHIQVAGAGINLEAAETPAVFSISRKGRVLLFSFGLESSGIPESWMATRNKPGLNFVRDLSHTSIQNIRTTISQVKSSNDVVIASIHWGGNWGYEISDEERGFARSLIDEAYVDVVHGHSSHHAKGIEVYQDKLILYGCGDFMNDYEGISGYEDFRADLALMYFPKIDSGTGKLVSLKIIPMQMKNLRLNHVQRRDAQWLEKVLNRQGRNLGTQVLLEEDNTLFLRWT
jgi:poly-gamma-glutamate synthesis protein (capsule biosynthesis protein)